MKSPDPELLEPLPVEVDGVAIAPEPAQREIAVRVAVPTAHEVVEAIRATITEAQSLRGQSPWSRSSTVELQPAHAVHRTSAFSRMLALQPRRLDALPAWWAARATDGRVEVARRLTIETPRKWAGGTWCMRGWLRSPWRARSIPVEVVMWSHLGLWTKLHVEPQRGVRIGRRYFRSGHRVLDALTDHLIREL